MKKEFHIFDAPLNGISLVEASAGTGKTYNIASLFVRTILEKGLMPSNILVLTYTEAATTELNKRLRNRISESINALKTGIATDEFLDGLISRYNKQSALSLLTQALYKFDEAQVSTIHGFCQKVLTEQSLTFGVSSDFDILANSSELLQDATDDYWRNFVKGVESEFSLALQVYLVELGYTPEKLFEFILPILSKPYLSLLPAVPPVKDFRALYSEFKNSFVEMKDALVKEEQILKETLQEGLLHKGVYNKNIFHYLERIFFWLDSEVAHIQPVDKLELFGSGIYQRVAKGKSIPEFGFTSKVDDYFEKLNRFALLEQAFLVEACFEIMDDFEYEKAKKELLTYDDLLLKVSNGLVSGNDELIRSFQDKYPVALIDEFQDTDPIQYSIFKTIYSNSENVCLFMIGDPKQAIYSFRGADIYTYLAAKKDAGADQTYSLSSNYRSSQKMIEAVNTVFNKTSKTFILDEIEFAKADYPENKPESGFLLKDGELIEPLHFIGVDTENLNIGDVRASINASVATEIVALLEGSYTIDDKRITESDIAVLVRKNFQALEIQQVLRQRGVKSIIKSQESVFISKESDELYILLSSIFENSFETGIRSALATEMLGYSAKHIYELLDNEQNWAKLYLNFLELHNIWKDRGFALMIDEAIQKFSIEENLAAYFDSERRITNLYHLIELLKKAQLKQQLTPFGLINYFKKRRQEEAIAKSDEELVRLESDDRLIQIITLHTSKGLEYPIVFCPYLWEGLRVSDQKFFTFHKEDNSFLDIGSKGEERVENRGLALEAELSESVRLAYVALTRAKSACFVHVIKGNSSEFSALASLTEGAVVVMGRINDKLSLNNNEYKKIHNSDSFKILESIKDISLSGNIKFREASYSDDVKPLFEPEHQNSFSTLNFSRIDLSNFLKITSFSSLSVSTEGDSLVYEKEGFDYDEINNSLDVETQEEWNQFNLPRGTKTGLLLHSIFEEIDFSKPVSLKPVIESLLEKYGFEPKWFGIVLELIEKTLDHELASNITLSMLQEQDKLVELEFHFPVKNINSKKLLSVIRNEEIDFEIESVNGFMKGFVDLIFRVGETYYILDYKSNYLGNSYEDYNLDSLTSEIEHSNYDLQYHIYTVAVHRFLSKRIKGYSYQKNFGGAIYLFLRGVEKGKAGSGVFLKKPDFSVIQYLDDYFRNGDSND